MPRAMVGHRPPEDDYLLFWCIKVLTFILVVHDFVFINEIELVGKHIKSSVIPWPISYQIVLSVAVGTTLQALTVFTWLLSIVIYLLPAQLLIPFCPRWSVSSACHCLITGPPTLSLGRWDDVEIFSDHKGKWHFNLTQACIHHLMSSNKLEQKGAFSLEGDFMVCFVTDFSTGST